MSKFTLVQEHYGHSILGKTRIGQVVEIEAKNLRCAKLAFSRKYGFKAGVIKDENGYTVACRSPNIFTWEYSWD